MAAFMVPAAVAIAAEFLPVLATKLGGERGREVAEHVVRMAATVAGTPKDATPREIIAALKEDSAKAAELRLKLEELDQAEHQRIVEDRADARRYQAQIGPRARMRGTLMLLGVVGGLIACIVAVFRSTTDPAALALLTTIAGALLKMLSDAFAFEFGSSSGSKEKDAHIENIQKALIDSARSRRVRSGDTAPPAPTARPPAAPPSHDVEDGRVEQAPAPEKPAEGDGARGSVTARITASGEGRDFVAELVALSG